MIIVTVTISDNLKLISYGSSFFINVEDEYTLDQFYGLNSKIKQSIKKTIKEYE